MKLIIFLLALMALACGGLYASPEDAQTTEFVSSCFDTMPKETLRKAASDELSRTLTSDKVKEAMLKGYELMAVERTVSNRLNCVYRFKRGKESTDVIRTQMQSYDQQYQLLLGEDLKLDVFKRKLDQNARFFTGNLINNMLYDYRTSHQLYKDQHLHVFVANCDYPKGKVWDALTRETQLNLSLKTVLSSNHRMDNQCLYYFTPDLQKFNP